MPGHIFISYHYDNGDFADNLRMKLKENGFDVWMSEAALNCGDNWRAEIDQAIEEASALILIMTPDAKASDYVTYEWAFAIGADVKVVPILLKKTELHPRLELLHYLDFTNRKARPWDDLIKALKEKDAPRPKKVHNSVSETIQVHSINIPSNVPEPLKQAAIKLDSTDKDERYKAIEFIGEYGHPEARELLLSATKHPLSDVRADAIRKLSISDKSVVPALLNSLNDNNANVRYNAVQVLGRIRDSSAVPGLINALNDPEIHIRKSAAWALGEIGDIKAVPALVCAFSNDIDNHSSEKLEFAKLVAATLTKIKDSSTFPELMDALRKSEVEISGCIAGAILEITEDTNIPDL